jgi:hypothetical protein
VKHALRDEITDIAYRDLEGIKKFYRQRIIDAIKEQLAHGPTVETKNRKDYDEEDLQLINSKEFWSLVRESRKSPTVPLELAEKRLSELD